MTASKYLVARASCGCVEAVRIQGAFEVWDEQFRSEFPHATQERAWPHPIRCDLHPPVARDDSGVVQ